MKNCTDNTAYNLAKLAAEKIQNITKIKQYKVAIILGSGWQDSINHNYNKIRISTIKTKVPGFYRSSVSGHRNEIISLQIKNNNVIVFGSRQHYYQKRCINNAVHPIQTAHALGSKLIILTSGVGSLMETWKPGKVVLIKDHINFTCKSPIKNSNFLDLSNLYCYQSRRIIKQSYPLIQEGIYIQVTGPNYETPSEILMMKQLGAQVVGMSLALEAIMAHALSMKVIGLSLITNIASGLQNKYKKLNHLDTLNIGNQHKRHLTQLISSILTNVQI